MAVINMRLPEMEETNGPVQLTDSAPYLYRESPIITEKLTNKIIGGTVAWNQLITSAMIPSTTTVNGITATNNGDGSVTLSGTATALALVSLTNAWSFQQNHVYYFGKGANFRLYDGYGADGYGIVKWGRASSTSKIYAYIDNGTTVSEKVYPKAVDLTQAFGSTIADYLYTLEQGQAGAGVAWFRNLFPADYYAYNAGELLSVKTSAHVTSGANLFNYEQATFNAGVPAYGFSISVNGYNVRVYGTATITGGLSFNVVGNYVNDDLAGKGYECQAMDVIGTHSIGAAWGFRTPTEHAFAIRIDAVTAGDEVDVSFRISVSQTVQTTWTPYVENVYPLDNDLELRGIPKLDADNKLYYDGDVYESTGSVTRKWAFVEYDGSSDENWKYESNATAGINFYITPPSTGVRGSIDVIRSNFVATRADNSFSLQKDTCLVSQTGNFNFSCGTTLNVASVAAWKTYLASRPLQVVYLLATPTTESATPFTDPQNAGYTEEYIDNRTVPVPVGHETEYFDMEQDFVIPMAVPMYGDNDEVVVPMAIPYDISNE